MNKINQKYEINGVSKSFIDWCNEYNRRPLLIRARMSTGMSLEQALRLIDNKRDNLFCINNKYNTLQYWCKYYAISSSTVRMRISKGYDLENAFKSAIDITCKLRKRKEYNINGEMLSLAEISKKYNINQSTITSRLCRGETIENALKIDEGNRKKYSIKEDQFARYSMWEINGQSKTLLQWCKDYNCSYDCIKERLLAGYSINEALVIKKLNTPKYLQYNEKFYTISELATVLNIKRNTLKNWLNRGLTIKEIKDKADNMTEYRTLPRPGMLKIKGEKLREIRLSKRIGQQKLSILVKADGCNLNKNAIRCIELGKWFITNNELNAFTNIFNIKPNDLL